VAAREVVGIILAAGDGERMGGSKALLLASGEPLAAAHVHRMREAGVSRVVLVVRPSVAARLGAFPDAQVLLSSAPDPAGSLAVAVRGAAIAKDALVLVTPVDAAPATLATIEALAAALAEAPLALAATPRHGGSGGHPILCHAEVLAPYREEATPPPLRDVLRSLGDRRLRVDVDDARVLVDLDTPDDVLAWTGHAPGFLGG